MFSLDDILKATGGEPILRRKKSFPGVSIDSRTLRKGELFIAIRGVRFDGNDFIGEAVKRGAAGVITDNAVKWRIERLKLADKKLKELSLVEVGDTIRALGDIAACHRKRFNIPVIGITGSNGKTSVKEMIWRILAKRFDTLKNRGTENNLIGLPLALLGLNDKHSVAVLEMGANHLGEIERLTEILRPRIGLITNIGQSHLEFLKDREGVLKAKSEMVHRLKGDDLLVLNGDDEMLSRVKTKCRIVRFGLKSGNDFRATNIISDKGASFVLNGAYPLTMNALGVHNVYNALAAIAVTSGLNIEIDEMREALSSFKLPHMRMEPDKVNGVHIINDAYNSNPLSLRCAVDAFSHLKTDGKKIVVSGDMLELGEKGPFYHREAGRLIAASPIDALIAVGELSRYTAEEASKKGMKKGSVWPCSDTEEAADILKRIAKRGDAILVKGSRDMSMEDIIHNIKR